MGPYHHPGYEYIVILPGEVPEAIKQGGIPKIWTGDHLSLMIHDSDF